MLTVDYTGEFGGLCAVDWHFSFVNFVRPLSTLLPSNFEAASARGGGEGWEGGEKSYSVASGRHRVGDRRFSLIEMLKSGAGMGTSATAGTRISTPPFLRVNRLFERVACFRLSTRLVPSGGGGALFNMALIASEDTVRCEGLRRNAPLFLT